MGQLKNYECEKCGRSTEDRRNPLEFSVKYDADLKLWLCNSCWFHTPPSGYCR